MLYDQRSDDQNSDGGTQHTETIIFPVHAENRPRVSVAPTAPFGSVPAAHSHAGADVAPHGTDAFERAEHVAVTTLDTMEEVEFGVLEEVRAEIIGLLDTFEHNAARSTEH